MIELKGMTWDHARGYDPMAATAQAYMEAHPGVAISWQKRSLKEFGDYPIEKLAELFDLLVIDHPFIGFGAESGCVIPLDEHLPQAFLEEQAAHSVGKSHPSYFWNGHQWALAIDAAAQIATYRDDLLEGEIPQTWDEVLALAKKLHGTGQWVAIPLCPIDSLMSLFSIAASTGENPCADSGKFVSRAVGRYALGVLLELRDLCHPESLDWNPIQLYNRMSSSSEIVYCPLAFGYTNYGRAGFAAHLLSFAGVPTGKGGILGGTGLAISPRCQHVEEAADYAMFTASPQIQRGLYFTSGGQPGHRSAWLDSQVNAACNDFFKNTLASLDHSYLRPRYNGYMHFQETAWYAVHAFLKEGHGSVDAFLDQLDNMYRDSLK